MSEIIGREHGRIVKPAAETDELAQLAQEQMEIAEEEMSKNYFVSREDPDAPLTPELEAQRAELAERRQAISKKVAAARAAQASAVVEQPKELITQSAPPRVGPGRGARGWCDFTRKMMDFTRKMKDFVRTMMDYVVKMMDFTGPHCTRRAPTGTTRWWRCCSQRERTTCR